MTKPDPEIIAKVMKWLRFGEEDINLAAHAMTIGADGVPYRLVAYHAQQCAEKCLKGFLVYHNVDFPYTHSIGRLLRICGELAEWPPNLKEAKELTPYAVTARYPGEEEEVTAEEAKRAVELARQVQTQVRKALEQLGMDLPK